MTTYVDPFAGLPETPALAQPDEALITEKQRDFIRKLMVERGICTTDEAVTFDPEHMARKQASREIDKLLRMPKAPQAAAAQEHVAESGPLAGGKVAEARYAIEVRGTLRFFQVDHGKEGTRWDGYVFVNELFGSPGDFRREAVRSADVRRDLLSEIAKDPNGAAQRFGQEVGACGICGSPLTDATSRALGIGPVCAERWGIA